MRCKRCGNSIKELFIYKGNEVICRKCIVYKDKRNRNDYDLKGKGDYTLNYSLTSNQVKASEFILNEIKSKKNCILKAVTGAGKTEIIYPLIKYCLDNKLRIGIVIPRKDVVIELYKRISDNFKLAKVSALYGGSRDKDKGDIIILTSHQLYRYEKYFDVMVIDEVDAFPFYNNEILNNFLNRSVKGNIVYMSATVPDSLIKKGYNIYSLNKRWHNNKLDVPIVKRTCRYSSLKRYIKKHNEGILIVYFPTIKEQIKFSKKLKISFYLINSKVKNREELLEKFHQLSTGIILSTLVLERGITFKNAHVIVYKADSELFSLANLVQIAGRVGRDKLYNSGKVIFLVSKKDRKIRKVIKFIKECNE